MCIRDRAGFEREQRVTASCRASQPGLDDRLRERPDGGWPETCLLYTSDAADERSSVDLGGRRIIKKKTKIIHRDVRSLRHTKNFNQLDIQDVTTKSTTLGTTLTKNV